jgi:hypothetical protein
MKIDYTITLNYGDDAPGDDEPSPHRGRHRELDRGRHGNRRLHQRERHLQAAVTPAQEAKAEVYKELGYRLVGNGWSRPDGHPPHGQGQGAHVQLIGPDGKTMKTLTVSTIGHHE